MVRHAQYVAHTQCTYIQPDSEYSMRHKALQPGPRWIGCPRRSNTEADRRLHDEEREHHGANGDSRRDVVCFYAHDLVILPHLDDDLAFCMPRFEVSPSLLGGLEREDPIHDRPDNARFNEGCDLAQLLAVRSHEDKRVAHAV